MSKLLAFFMALLIVISSVSLTASAAKVDMDYEGDIDPYTGLPANSEKTTDSNIITIGSGISYNKVSNKFVYSILNSDQSIESNVLSGTVTTDEVSLSVPSDVSAVLYQNGRAMNEANYSMIKDAGSYVLAILEADNKYQLIRFMIVPEKTCILTVFQVPSECVIIGADVNGEKKRITDRGRFDMAEDGEYAISYRCEAINRDYMLHLEIDHTPPAVTFKGLKEDGSAKGPVVVEGIEKTDTITVWFNEENIKYPLSDNTFRTPGQYKVTVTDDAGNVVVKEFVINFYLNEQGWLFGLVLVAVIAAAVIYMIETKRKFRVR